MTGVQRPSGLTRRQFIPLLTASGVTAAGGYLLYEDTPWLNDESESARLRAPLAAGPELSRFQNLIRAATLAASSHNTQPWTFAIRQNTIEIHPDRRRRPLVLDPEARELWISLLCALENLLVAAHAIGYATQVTHPAARRHSRAIES